MLSILKNVTVKNSLYFTVGNILNAGIPFFLLPILTRYLTPSEYGTLAMYTIVLGICNAFTGVSVHGAIAREYFEFDRKRFSYFVYNCILILLLSSVFVGIVVFLNKNLISKYTQIPSYWLLFIVLVSALQFIQWILLALLQVTEKGLHYISVQIGSSVIQFFVIIYFVVVIDMSWEAKVIAQLVVFFMSGIYTLYYLSNNNFIKINFDWDLLKKGLTFGLPLIPHTIGMYAISFIDRVLLTNLMGLEIVGIYTVGYQLGMFMLVIQDAVNKAWVPWFYKQLSIGDKGRMERIVKYSYGLSFLYVTLALIYSYLIEIFIPILVGDLYQDSMKVIVWIALGYAFNGMYKLVTNYLMFERRTGILSIITFFTALVNIFISYYLIKENGMIGAAQGTMIAFLISFILTWMCAQKLKPMPWFNKVI